LRSKGIEEFLPLYLARRRWSDRTAQVELPLFPGYVFTRIDPQNRLAVLTTPGVRAIVGCGTSPSPIDDQEIHSLQRLTSSGLAPEPWPFLNVGQYARIRHGALKGIEGILLEYKSRYRVVLSITLLQRSVAVEVDRAWLEPVAGSRSAA
jgi:transcription antitermination factor NusG